MKILPLETTAIVTDNMDMDETNDDIAELVLALNNLSIVDSLTVEEYIDIDSNLVSTGLLTEEELIEEILLTEGVLQQAQEDIEENSSEGEEASISVKLGREALMMAKKFLEQREFTTENDIRYMRNIIQRLDESVERSKRQTSSLIEYINQ